MDLITRDNVSKFSDLMLATSAATITSPNALLGQASSTTPSNATAINGDVVKYVNDNIGSVVKAVRNGSLTSLHLRHAAAATHLMARQLDKPDLNKQWAKYLAELDFDTYASNWEGVRAQTAASAANFDSTILPSDISIPYLSPDLFKADKARMIAMSGLGGILHSIGDTYTAAKIHMHSDVLKPAVWDSRHTVPLTYRSHQAPHFLLVCATQKQKKKFCDELNVTAGILAISGAVLAVIGAACVAGAILTVGVGAVLCGLGLTSIGASIGIHGVALWLLTTFMDC
jgi:hypothetical protein